MRNETAARQVLIADCACDAIILNVQKQQAISETMEFFLRAVDDGSSEATPSYISIRDAAAKDVLHAPKAAPPGEICSIRAPELQGFVVRFDFSERVRIETLALLENFDLAFECSYFVGGFLLHRDGTVHELFVDPAAIRDLDAFDRARPLFCAVDLRDAQDVDAYARRIAQKVHDEFTEAKPYLDTADLAPYKKFLFSKSRIQIFMAQMNDVAACHAQSQGRAPVPYVISKHTLNPSWLTARRATLLTALRIVMNYMAERNIPCYLAYGTLLGAMRNAKFIPHDDDVDVIVDLGATSCADMRNKLAALSATMTTGEIVPREADPEMLHLICDTEFGAVDIFSFWTEGDRAHLLMENYQLRDIPAGILIDGDAGAAALYGETFPTPPFPEEFLRERYGADWKIPNQYHEWPWPLED